MTALRVISFLNKLTIGFYGISSLLESVLFNDDAIKYKEREDV
jgi:hypothetical protein